MQYALAKSCMLGSVAVKFDGLPTANFFSYLTRSWLLDDTTSPLSELMNEWSLIGLLGASHLSKMHAQSAELAVT
jgi:hypothetical protein